MRQRPMRQQNGPHGSDAFTYLTQDADAYGSLEIAGTSYEIGFDALAEKLGDLTGTRWLDFGAGAGRSSLFLRNLGAAFVVGVDHNFTMVKHANKQHVSRVAYALIGRTLPVANEAMDGAISCNVYTEIPSKRDMVVASAEIYRVLKPSSQFFIMTANPESIGHVYKSFPRTGSIEHLSSGSRVRCVITTPEGVVEVEDHYWTLDDYQDVLQAVGFEVRATDTPTSLKDSFVGTDESIIGPFLILTCFKE